MTIIHKIDSFFNTIFEIENQEQILQKLSEYYSFGSQIPLIKIQDGFVYVEIGVEQIILEEKEFSEVIRLCESKNYFEAKPKLQNLISKNPTNSEYYRILGQIHSESGDQEEAINFLIDSLKWDSKNSYALLMMGNIFAKFKNDIETAMKYYDQALIVNPKDFITINNIGANLLQQNKFTEAKKYFNKALNLNDKYPNTHYALGIIASGISDYKSAFNHLRTALKFSLKKDNLYDIILNELIQVSKLFITNFDGSKIFNPWRVELESLGGIEIEFIEDPSILTTAKIEFAQNYKREKHLIRYKEKSIGLPHLIMHELTHLKFVIEAQSKGNNLLFVSSGQQENIFKNHYKSSFEKMKKGGISEDSISRYSKGLFDGLNSQIFNSPIDLFIENYLFETHEDLRPFQFLSLYQMINEGLFAVTDKQVLDLTPSEIVSKSKTYNLVSAHQFKELYGVDLIEEYKSSRSEMDQSLEFYNEFLEYRNDKDVAEEYELVQNWANDLNLSEYFELVGEEQYRSRGDVDSFVKELEIDPFGVNNNDPIKEREMKKFLKEQEELGLNNAVIMFMISALEFFSDKNSSEIKKIAFEIAMQGTQGYDPNISNYKLTSIPNVVFSGYHILAYYYVSFALSLPEMLKELQLPFEEEYKIATKMYNPK